MGVKGCSQAISAKSGPLEQALRTDQAERLTRYADIAELSRGDGGSPNGEGNGPIDLRLYLKLGNKTLSETWIYQYFP